MKYAIRNDGLGWRSVGGPEDVGPDETFSADVPSPRAMALAIALAAIKTERDRLRFEGGVKVGGHWFLSNQTATTEYNSIINLGAPDATVIRPNWRTMDGAEVPMSPFLAKQIIVAGFAQAAAIDDAALAHKSAMEASADPASYDFSADWPEVYGE